MRKKNDHRSTTRVLTSDESVDYGAAYELVLTCPEREPIRAVIRAETFARLLRSWKSLEVERRERISFGAFLAFRCEALPDRAVNANAGR